MQFAMDSTFAAPVFDQSHRRRRYFCGGEEYRDRSVWAGTYAFEFLPDTTYYWRVRAARLTLGATAPKAGTVDSPWSAVFSFKMAGIQVAGVSSPAKGAYDVPTTPTFVWTEAKGAVLYELEVSTDSTFRDHCPHRLPRQGLLPDG